MPHGQFPSQLSSSLSSYSRVSNESTTGKKVPWSQFWFAVLLRYPNESTASPNLVCGTIGGTIGGTLGSNSVAAVVKACIVMKYLYTITSYSFGAFHALMTSTRFWLLSVPSPFVSNGVMKIGPLLWQGKLTMRWHASASPATAVDQSKLHWPNLRYLPVHLTCSYLHYKLLNRNWKISKFWSFAVL